jgi:predicted transcriptional regulator YdeE
MKLRLQNRGAFNICGYLTETDLENCGKDIGILWNNFEINKKNLYTLFGVKNDFYGLMWKTQNGQYCYLLGVDTELVNKSPEGAVCKQIPSEKYAVVSVPSTKSAVEAWTEFYDKVLPNAKLIPAAGHVFDFEYYPEGEDGSYELWTPVTEK